MDQPTPQQRKTIEAALGHIRRAVSGDWTVESVAVAIAFADILSNELRNYAPACGTRATVMVMAGEGLPGRRGGWSLQRKKRGSG